MLHALSFIRSLAALSVLAVSMLVPAYAQPAAVPSTSAVVKTWNFKNADIRAVIEAVAQLTGKNFIIDPRVQGKVSLVTERSMDNKGVYAALLSMLQVLNFVAIPSGHYIKIVPAIDAKGYGGTLAAVGGRSPADAVVVNVVAVNTISAEQLVPTLRPLMLDWGHVSAYAPANSIVLASSASNVAQLVKIIHQLDHDNAGRAEVVKLRYANAVRISKVLVALQSANRNQGKSSYTAVVADAGENALVISGNLYNRKAMRRLINELDTEDSAGANSTAVIRLNYLTAKKVAPMLMHLSAHPDSKNASSSSGYGVNANASLPVSVEAVEADNALVVSGTRESIGKIKRVIAKIDVRPQEVLVQAIIVKMSESQMLRLGVQWGMGSPEGGLVAGAAQAAFASGVGYIKSGNFSAIIQALRSTGDTDILSTPSVLVLNNERAKISDGKNVGLLNRQYSTNTSTDGATTLPYNTYDRKDVTLSLDVTPQIAPDNTVRLQIKHQDDSLTADTRVTTDNPTLNTSKIDTTVLVNSGDILVLGGLVDNNQDLEDAKLPILGDIPLIGRLFHYKTHNLEKKKLMVFIRPIIINDRDQAKQLSDRTYNGVRRQQLLRRSDLHSKQPPLLPALPLDKSNMLVLPKPAV